MQPSRPASTAASVLLPEPFGPMIACTSPPFTERSMPCRISRPSASCACKSLFSSIGTTAVMAPPSADAAFEAHGEQLLCFDREFHRQLFEHFLAKSVDDQ